MDTFATRIKESRIKKGLSQAQLAELVGIRQQSLQEIESGKTKKTAFILELAEALDVSPYWLLNGKEPRKKSKKK